MKTFNSLGEFATHLRRTAALGDVVTSYATKECAKVIAGDAKARIGSYQDSEGPFPAWANLAEATVADRIAKGFTPDDPLLRTGELRESIGVQVEGHEAQIGTPDQVALYQEVGTSRIPPRPFLGPAAIASRVKVAKTAANVLVAWVGGSPWRKPKTLIE